MYDCVLEEQSEIINRAEEGAEPGAAVPVMIVGNNNVFEVGTGEHENMRTREHENRPTHC